MWKNAKKKIIQDLNLIKKRSLKKTKIFLEYFRFFRAPSWQIFLLSYLRIKYARKLSAQLTMNLRYPTIVENFLSD